MQAPDLSDFNFGKIMTGDTTKLRLVNANHFYLLWLVFDLYKKWFDLQILLQTPNKNSYWIFSAIDDYNNTKTITTKLWLPRKKEDRYIILKI